MRNPQRILIVGEEPEVVDLLKQSLTRAGYSTDAAADGSYDLALQVLARAEVPMPSQYQFGSVAVDLAKGRVVRNGDAITVTAKEMDLLRYLIAHRGDTLSRHELLREVWNYQSNLTRTVDVHIAGLRQKVEENPEQPEYILTVRGRGYLFRG